jgi:methyltransferase
MTIPIVALAAVVAMMLVELAVSRRHERALLQRGAIEPPDPVYRVMQWAYPGVFVAMTIEGVLAGRSAPEALALGVVIFAAAKALKTWAIVSLGTFWTYRVIIVPGAELVTTGPYRLLRHPNYVAVVGELIGMALITGAVVMGPLGLMFFGWLLLRRIRAEEAALGMR